MSLLQDVLRSKTEDIERRLNNVRLTRRAHLDNDDSDDEIVNVVRPNLSVMNLNLINQQGVSSWHTCTDKTILTSSW